MFEKYLGLRDIPLDSSYETVTPFFLFICVFHSLAAMAGSLAFQGAYSVSENQSTLTITVNRSGSTTGAASVTVISLDGTATAGSDFTAVSQILTWGAGDALNKTFTVAIKDDAVVEGAEVLLAVYFACRRRHWRRHCDYPHRL